jgi:S-formylglutathione hydrolase
MSGTWTTETIAARTAHLFEPSAGPPRFGVLYLHDLGGETLAGQPSFTRLLDERRLACICPLDDRSWWADRICPEFDAQLTPERYLVDHVRPFFGERWRLPSRAVGLLGIGMGGQGALRLAFKRPDLFPVVAAIAPAIEYHQLHGQGTPLDEMYDSKEQCRQDTVGLHVHPSRYPEHIFFCIDPTDAVWYRGNDRLHEKLNALGIPHECDLTTTAGGHSWTYFQHMAERAVRFLDTGLELQSRRLL